MFSLRKRFSILSIVCAGTLVLVFAGSAWAAGDDTAKSSAAQGLNKKQKKQVEGIAKKFAGAPGPQGPVGPAGPQGSAGSKGDKGEAGPQGAKGATGKTGATGKKGATGGQGLKGATGPKGSTGLQGPKGATGAKGATGTKGATGATGTGGVTGPAGPTGAKGPTGDAGAKGLTGAKGPTGAPGGATGSKGATGATGPGGGLETPIVGTWSANGEAGAEEGKIPLQASISFVKSISPAPDLVYRMIGFGGATFAFNTETGAPIDFEVTSKEFEERCGTGTVTIPDAKPGNLCVYVGTEQGLLPAGFGKLAEENEAPIARWASPSPTTGAIIPLVLNEPVFEFESLGGFANGSWAVGFE